MAKFLDAFGVEKMPWVIRVYLLLFFAFMVMLLTPLFSGFQSTVNNDAVALITSIAADGLKLVLGALLGSLSIAAEAQWKRKADHAS